MSKCRTSCDQLSIRQGELWLLIDSLTYGGIETHVVELAHGLKSFNQPVRVVLLTRYATTSAIINRLEQRDIPFSFVADLFNSAFTQDAHSNTLLRQLLLIVRYYQPQIVHAHGYKASILSKLCKLQTNGDMKQLTTFHAGETPVGRVKWYDRLDRYSAFISDHRLSVSGAIQAKVRAPSQVLNNFISLPPPSSVIKDQNRNNKTQKASCNKVAFVGRLSHEKGPDRFIEVARHFPEMTFHLYGDGDMREQLESQAGANVQFHGFQTDMNQHWANIDVLLITSRYEGLPMTAIEAMARGIALISLDVGAITTLINHNHNGWVAKDMTELRSYIKTWSMLNDRQRQEIQMSAYQTVKKNFSTEAIVPKILSLYFS